MDIKNSLFAAKSDLKTEIRAVATRLEHVETASTMHGAAIQQVLKVTSVHAQHLMDMHRHMEDLDNRSHTVGATCVLEACQNQLKGPSYRLLFGLSSIL